MAIYTTLYDIGDRVLLKEPEIEAVVDAIWIEGNNIWYEVITWAGGERQKVTVRTTEVERVKRTADSPRI